MKLTSVLLCVLCLSACATKDVSSSSAKAVQAAAENNLPAARQRPVTKEEMDLILKGKIRSKAGGEQTLTKEDMKKLLKGEYKNPDNEFLKLDKQDVERILKGK